MIYLEIEFFHDGKCNFVGVFPLFRASAQIGASYHQRYHTIPEKVLTYLHVKFFIDMVGNSEMNMP